MIYVIYDAKTGLVREVRTPALGHVAEGMAAIEHDQFIEPRFWRVSGGVLVAHAPVVFPEPPQPQMRDQVMGRLSACRYQVEIGGTALPDGTRILTDREDQAMTTQALLKLERSPAGTTISFKSPSGFVALDLEAIHTVWLVGSEHVQRCFSAEGAVAARIAELTDEALAGFDVRAAFDAALKNLISGD